MRDGAVRMGPRRSARVRSKRVHDNAPMSSQLTPSLETTISCRMLLASAGSMPAGAPPPFSLLPARSFSPLSPWPRPVVRGAPLDCRLNALFSTLLCLRSGAIKPGDLRLASDEGGPPAAEPGVAPTGRAPGESAIPTLRLRSNTEGAALFRRTLASASPECAPAACCGSDVLRLSTRGEAAEPVGALTGCGPLMGALGEALRACSGSGMAS